MSNKDAPYDVLWCPDADNLDMVDSKYTYSKYEAERVYDLRVASRLPVVLSKGTRTIKSWFPEDHPE